MPPRIYISGSLLASPFDVNSHNILVSELNARVHQEPPDSEKPYTNSQTVKHSNLLNKTVFGMPRYYAMYNRRQHVTNENGDAEGE